MITYSLMHIRNTGTISYRKPNNLLIGSLTLKIQVLLQHPQKFLAEYFCNSSCVQLVFALYLLMLRDFLIVKSRCHVYCWQLPTKTPQEITQFYRVRITSVTTISTTNFQRENTEYINQRLQMSKREIKAILQFQNYKKKKKIFPYWTINSLLSGLREVNRTVLVEFARWII